MSEPASACPGEPTAWGEASSDVVYAFTPTVDGEYEFVLTPSGFDSFLYVVTDCGSVATSCVAANDEFCTVGCTESLTATLVAGNTYFVIVDGYSNVLDISGEYTLAIDTPGPPVCQVVTASSAGMMAGGLVCAVEEECDRIRDGEAVTVGDTCANPFPGPLLFSINGTTDGYAPDYGTVPRCPVSPGLRRRRVRCRVRVHSS